MKHYELKPIAQKSFYGKATVTENASGAALLRSYDTDVCGIVSGRFVRYWGGYSATTMKHINAFRAAYGLNTITKKEWDALPVAPFEWVYFYAETLAAIAAR